MSFSDFYKCIESFGIKYRQIAYIKKVAKPLSKSHLKYFIKIYLFILVSREFFEVIFIDESSVCPSNFKAKQWQVHGVVNHVSSNLKYEKITILGAMSRKQILAIQFLRSGFTSNAFRYFVYELLEKFYLHQNNTRQLVIVLDNCSSHRYHQLKELSRKTDILFLLNLPHRCELNPIEYLWEFAKRPLRGMTEYDRYFYK